MEKENKDREKENRHEDLNIYKIELEIQNEELIRSQAEKDRTLRKYYELYDFSPVPFVTIKEKGLIGEINRAGAELLDINREYGLNKPFSLFLHSDDQEKFYRHRMKVLESGKKETEELRIISRGGRTYDVLMESLGVMKDDSTERKSCLSALVDVSEYKALLREYQKAKDKAEAASDVKSQFLANMSHEIRTPLNGIIGMSELALSTELTEEQREYLELVQRSGEDLLKLINRILDYSKMENHKEELLCQWFKLSDLLQSLMAIYQPLAEKSEVALTLTGERGDHWVYGDEGRIKQVLNNLIENAIKFTPAGKVSLHLKILELEGDRAEYFFQVEDQGIGIRKEDVQKLFESFSQLDNGTQKNYPGAGLGLAIIRKLTELMGGEVYFVPSEDRGSTFVFRLPLRNRKHPPLEEMEAENEY